MAGPEAVRLHHWLNSSLLQLYAVDLSGRIVSTLGGGLHSFGMQPGVYIGHDLGEIAPRLKELAVSVIRTHDRITATGMLGGRFNENRFYMLASVNRDEKQEVEGALLLVLDVSHMSKDVLEDLIRRLDAVLPKAQALMDEEAKGLSLRTKALSAELEYRDWKLARWADLIGWVQTHGAKAFSLGVFALALYLAKALGVAALLQGAP